MGDSINRRELLPVNKYFVGEPLPPHLSPFISEERRIGDYMPPEEKELLGLIEKKTENDEEGSADEEDANESDEKSDEDSENEDIEDEEDEEGSEDEDEDEEAEENEEENEAS